ncbi:MAG: hypothetical protein HY917_01385, partial [Candidatus Diapherotrites archaeon]|nr:hypothetical protein [Candidatus Diapherotrites archaeon]
IPLQAFQERKTIQEVIQTGKRMNQALQESNENEYRFQEDTLARILQTFKTIKTKELSEKIKNLTRSINRRVTAEPIRLQKRMQNARRRNQKQSRKL